MLTVLDTAQPTISLDLGGTYFRSANVLTDGTVSKLTIADALSFKHFPNSDISSLQERLLQWVITEAERLADETEADSPVCAISLGAALNETNGIVYESGPLWGGGNGQFNMLEELRSRRPTFRWSIVNDVTAMLRYHAWRLRHSTNWKKLLVLTVSSGIACRVLDRTRGMIPVHPKFGIQGEIGHVKVSFEVGMEPISLRCDCGGIDHLNAFCSGRGIEAVLRYLAENNGLDSDSPLYCHLFDRRKGLANHLSAAVAVKDRQALKILQAVTKPVANAIVNAITLDPTIDRIVLTGGVVEGFGGYYRRAIVHHIMNNGPYIIGTYDPNYLPSMIEEAADGGTSGLVGAALSVCTDSFRISTSKVDAKWMVNSPGDTSYWVEERSGFLEGQSGRVGLDFLSDYKRCIVIVDKRVQSKYGAAIERSLNATSDVIEIIEVDSSEEIKSLETIVGLTRKFDSANLNRRSDPIIVIGGGTLLDVVGFACSMYRRGIPYFRIPTTLVGMVDAGIGVKTGINFEGSKNKLGTYFSPEGVIIDLNFLSTLPKRHIANGLSEVLKLGICKAPRIFKMLEEHAKDLVEARIVGSSVGRELVHEAISNMLDELCNNLCETELNRLVDFGHSFSPKIEMTALPSLLHGEAVSIDMVLCSAISRIRGILLERDFQRILSVVRALGLPTTNHVCSVDLLHEALTETALHRDGLQRVPLPTTLGTCVFTNDIKRHEIDKALRMLRI